jgi:ATP-binding cassette subfamily B protein
LKENLKEVTKIIVTPRIFTIMNADKILVLENGKIVEIGNHTQLLKNCIIYREIYESQIGEKINV